MIAFEVLCKMKSANSLLGIIDGLTRVDAKFIDSSTNWASATKWVEWWMRSHHLKPLQKIMPRWINQSGSVVLMIPMQLRGKI